MCVSYKICANNMFKITWSCCFYKTLTRNEMPKGPLHVACPCVIMNIHKHCFPLSLHVDSRHLLGGNINYVVAKLCGALDELVILNSIGQSHAVTHILCAMKHAKLRVWASLSMRAGCPIMPYKSQN